ncbi:TRAP transporter substrate-binding protein [Chloroflexota bacterium]
MRRLLVLLCALIISLSLVFSGCAGEEPSAVAPTPTEAETITIKYHTYLSQTYAPCVAIDIWMDYVEGWTDGLIEFERYYSAALFKAPDEFEAVSSRAIDMSHNSVTGYAPANVPLGTLGQMIYLTEYPDVAMASMNKLVSSESVMREEWEGKGTKLLTYVGAGGMCLGTKEPVTTLEDLQGIRVRAASIGGEAFSLLGAAPVALSWGEVYDALDKGVIDAWSWAPMDLGVDTGTHEIAPYFTDIGVGHYGTSQLFMNLDTFKSLPSYLQSMFVETALEVCHPHIYQQINAKGFAAIDTIAAAGGSVTSLSPDEKERWKSKVVPMLWDSWIEEREAMGLPAQRIFDKYLDLLEEIEPFAIYKSPYL